MKCRKTLLSVCAIAALALCLLIVPARTEAAVVKSGTCGDNLTWILDDTGTLTISGTGEMSDYTGDYIGNSDTPWGTAVTRVIIEKGVTGIGRWAFGSCDALESVSISDTVTNIRGYAFWKCNSLTAVKIPDSVTTIGYEAFYYCSQLTDVTLGKGVTTIDYGAFRYACFNGIYIPDSVTTIGQTAFSDSETLTSITLGSGVKNIGRYAFSGCTQLKYIYYRGSEDDRAAITVGSQNSYLTDATWYYNRCIGNQEHTYSAACDPVCDRCEQERDAGHSYDDLYDKYCNVCNALRDKPTGVTGDCTWTLDGTDLTISGNGAMENYSSTTPWGKGIKTVTIEDGVTGIGNNAFYSCFDLYSVKFGNGLKSIGDQAFSCCLRLSSASIPAGVETIGEGAFEMCEDLYGVRIPASVTSIGRGAFSLCRYLTGIAVDENNTVYSSDENRVLFDKEKTTLIQAHCAISGNYIIPGSVTTIKEYAFYACNELTDITLPTSVTDVEATAFYDCYDLRNVYYAGDEAQRSQMRIGYNPEFTGANWHYNSCIGAAEHAFTWVIDAEPSCGENGSKHQVCSVCNGVRNENTIIEATGNHSYDSICDAECNVCRQARTAPHNYEWITDRQNTCGADGLKHEACKACQATRNENTVIAATGEHNFEWIIEKEATCGADGIKYEKCNVCQATRNENTVIAATGEHNFEWIIDKEATCGDAGVKHEGCAVCGETRSENTVIPASGNHSYNNDCDAECNTCKQLRVPVHKVILYSFKNATNYPFSFANGIYSSTNKASSSAATVTLTVLHSGSITVEYYTSTEQNYDKLTIKHNSTVKATASGSTSWTSVTIQAVAGDTITITYSKDGSVSHNLDTVYFKITSDMMPAENAEPTCKGAVLCDVCGEVVKEALAHTYSAVCDNTCNVCGATRTAAEHSYDNACDSVCNLCAYKRTVSEHIYTDVCDADCNECGYLRTPPHNYQWIIDKENNCGDVGIKHEECTVCHIKRNENTVIAATGNHGYDNACDAACNICGYRRTAPHDYQWIIDKENTCGVSGLKHEECTLCHSKRNINTVIAATGEHVFTDAEDDTCNVCGREYVLIKFNSNGGTSIATVRTSANKITSLPGDIPSKSGYFFCGWSTSKYGDVAYSAGGQLSIETSVTLYAQWDKYCENCNGDGKTSSACSTCGGNGIIRSTCSSCSGAGGSYAYSSTCSRCRGYGGFCNYCGSAARPFGTCGSCGSNRSSTSLCGSCSGSGTIRSEWYDCSYCSSGKVTRTCSTCSGSGVRSATCSKCQGTGHYKRTAANAPAAPVILSMDADRVTLQAINNGEYSLDGITWQESPVFENLEQGKKYSFYQRYVKTDITLTSPTSAALVVVVDHVYDNPCDTTCNGCGYVRTVQPHSFTAYEFDNNATCTEDGTQTAKCDHCDVTETIIKPNTSLGHSFTDYVSNQDATCTQDGSKTAKCDRCEEKDTVTDEGTALGHSFTVYISNKDATWEKDGTKTAACDNGCGATDTVSDRGTKLPHGWVEEEGDTWYYYYKGKMTTGWLEYGPVWYYFNEDGTMFRGFLYYGKQWYYFNNIGRMHIGWTEYQGNWYYMDANGHRVSGVYTVDGVKHKFSDDGIWLGEVKNGWVEENGKWYYYTDDVKTTGWLEQKGTWYYFNPRGQMVTGWLEYGPVWYYFNDNGTMFRGFLHYGGEWYFFNDIGRMHIGWAQYQGKWYYMDANGYRVHGRQIIEGKTYLFAENGAMHTGWYSELAKIEAPWAQAYIDEIQELLDVDWVLNQSGFAIVYVDDDDIPEVWINTNIVASGCLLLTYHNGEVYSHFFSSYGGCAFQERTGLFTTNGGRQGYYYDEIWMLSNGEVTKIGGGVYQEIIRNGQIVGYSYSWNGKDVSESEYFAAVDQYFTAEVTCPDEVSYRALKNQLNELKYVDGKTWYYYEPSGEMAAGWQYIGGKWYYFFGSGEMATGTVTIGGKNYRFDANGVCLNP